MGKETYPDPRVVVLSKEVVFTKINGKEDTVLAKKYGIAGFPTAIVASANGEEIDRIVGFSPPEQFSSTVKDYLAGRNTLAYWEEQARKNSDDLALAFLVGDKYLWRSSFDEAEAQLQKVVAGDPENKTGKADTAAHYLGLIAYKEKNYPDAVTRFASANKLYPNSGLAPDNDIYVAIAYEKNGDNQKAIENYQKYMNSYPEGEDRDYVTFKLASSYEKVSDKDQAIEYYQKYLDNFPEGDDRVSAQEHIDKLKGQPEGQQQH
jgi:tetratricopeptide (TPR) repeat protein